MRTQQTKDPVTGEPTKHPAGFAGGGAAGAVAGAAAGSLAGPVGTVVGAVAGGMVGARAGEGVAASVNPKDEEKYWRENFKTRPYVQREDTFDTYAPAYTTGYVGFSQYGAEGRSFDEAETELRRDYEARGKNGLSWDRARSAARDAWHRVEERIPGDADEDGF